MVKLSDILDEDDLYREIDAGYIRERVHPDFPELRILNYSEKAQYENHWTDTTRICRGLIYNSVTDEVLARPFAKFFNFGQGEAEYDLDAPVYFVGDKADGSLGIGYIDPEGHARIATRGSFDSDQAHRANDRNADGTNSKMFGAFEQLFVMDVCVAGYTPLYEIIYPENRIVLNYGDLEELRYLGAVNNATGAYAPPAMEHAQFMVEDNTTLGGVLSRAPRVNAEGYVVWLDEFTAVKIKQQDYVELHRIVTGLNRKSIWRALKDGTFGELMEQLPDELYAWAEGVSDELAREWSDLYSDIQTYYGLLIIKHGHITERKAQAQWIQQVVPAEYRGFVFAQLDGKSIHEKVWNMIEPIGGDK